MIVSNQFSNQAYEHPILKEVFKDLSFNFINSKHYHYTEVKKKDIVFKKIKKAIWLVSILSLSENDLHRIRAQRFASLLFLTNTVKDKGYHDILRTCYVLFSRLGNLTGTKFFKDLYENWTDNGDINPVDLISKYDFGDILTLELLLQRQDKIISTLEDKYLVTEFQKRLWNELLNNNNIAVSAPTSSGKSFIIKQYLANIYNKRDQFSSLYIVPSRALINQVSEEFRSVLKGSEVSIKTAYIETKDEEEETVKEDLSSKILYVLTPERCIKLLSADIENNIQMDFIFIDEIQGVEDEQGRGATFENVFEDLSTQFKNSKIVTAGPNILKPENAYTELFNRAPKSISTSLSPVIQFKKVIRGVDDFNLEVEIRDDINPPEILYREIDFNSYNFFKRKKNGEILEKVVNLIAPEELNLIYSNRGDYAEDWAREFQDSKSLIDITPRVKELVDFLKDEFNSKYYLIDCLKKGIAFHHGKLPDIIRKEVEELFLSGDLKSLFCTSTLIEGVNLPASNLFILTPKKNIEELSDFEFGNLIGRAGRLNKSLFGTIYFIEKPDYQGKLAKEYYDTTYEKKIETFSTKSFPLYDFKNLSKNIHDIIVMKDEVKKDLKKTSRQRQLTLFIRNKYIKNEKGLEDYLRRKNIGEEDIQSGLSILESQLSTLSIPKSIILENQSIDPILQNELFLKIKNEIIDNWVITPNSDIELKRTKESIENVPNNKRPLFWQLFTILEGLDSIFEIRNEIFNRNHIKGMYPIVMTIHATTWLQGKSFKELISNDINYYSSEKVSEDKRIDPNDKKAVNNIINKVIKINSSVVTYVLVKYMKLLVDILNHILNEDEKEKYKMTLGLPTALELGTRDKNVRLLISNGISRTIAISVAKKYVKDTSKDYRENSDIMSWLSTKEELSGLKPIYNRYLKRLRLFKE